VDIERKKLQKIYTLVEEVRHDTNHMNAMIEVAKENKDAEERKELISDIKLTAADVQEKVTTAALLQKEVKDINTVLKEKKKAQDAEDEEK
jgi:hypothetical protein